MHCISFTNIWRSRAAGNLLPTDLYLRCKAAPAHVIAQDIIHLLLVMSDIINNDPEVSPYMKLVMVENYNVSYAEKSDPLPAISPEQISPGIQGGI